MASKTFYALSDEKRNRIIYGLVDVFSEKHYDSVTVSDIVKYCTIPRGSFYQYFSNKFDAFMEVMNYIKDLKMAYLKDYNVALGKAPLLDIYIDLVKGGLAFAKSYPKVNKIGAHLYGSQSVAVKEVLEHLEKMGISMLSELLIADQEKGYLSKAINPHVIAKMLYNINAKDLVYEVIKGTPDHEVIEEIESLIHIIKYGVLKEENNENSF